MSIVGCKVNGWRASKIPTCSIVAVQAVRGYFPIHAIIVFVPKQFSEFYDISSCSCAMDGRQGSEEVSEFRISLLPTLFRRGTAENITLIMYPSVRMGVFIRRESLGSSYGQFHSAVFAFCR